MTIKTINALATAINFGAPFYADEIGLNGGNISTLKHYNLIKRVGEKDKMVCLDEEEGIYKKIKVAKWEVNHKAIQSQYKAMNKECHQLEQTIDALAKCL